MLLRPMRILNVRDLKESIRVGAADPQSRADAFAVLLLALDADDLGLVLLPRFGPVERRVCLSQNEIRWLKIYLRWQETYSLLMGWSGSLPAAAMQVKMAMMTMRMARYFIFRVGLVWFGFRRGLWVLEIVGWRGFDGKGGVEVFMDVDSECLHFV